jgi:putative flippase GtrA
LRRGLSRLESWKSKRAPPVQFLLYLTISSTAVIVNLFVGFSLYALIGLSARFLYSLSVAIGYLAGMAVNWSLNRAFTFPYSGRRRLAELRTFLVVALAGLLLTVPLAGALRYTLAPHVAQIIARSGLVHAVSAETTAHFAAVGMVAVYSFLSHKWLTFAHGIRFQVSRLRQLACGRSTEHSDGFGRNLSASRSIAGVSNCIQAGSMARKELAPKGVRNA